MMTGNTHPRLANEDVTNLVIPIPPLDVQQLIAAEVKARRERAQTLRAEAEATWDEAKARFEAAFARIKQRKCPANFQFVGRFLSVVFKARCLFSRCRGQRIPE